MNQTTNMKHVESYFCEKQKQRKINRRFDYPQEK